MTDEGGGEGRGRKVLTLTNTGHPFIINVMNEDVRTLQRYKK